MSGIRDSALCRFFLIFIINYLLINDSIKQVFCEKSSGFYVDNGQQTVMHAVTKREKRDIQNEILEFLDLPEKPLLKNKLPSPKNSGLEFLIDVYKKNLNQSDQGDDFDNSEDKYDSDQNKNESDFPGLNSRVANESDVIISFTPQYRKFSGVTNRRGKKLLFDMSEVPYDAAIIGAELRFYRSLKIKQKKYNKPFKISAYRIFKTHRGTKELKLISSINKNMSDQGWMTLNVSAALQYWVRYPGENRGLYISIQPADKSVFEILPEEIGIVGVNGAPEKQPFMVGFFQTPDTDHKRYHRKRKNKRNKRSVSTFIDDEIPFYQQRRNVHSSDKKACQMKSFRVNFIDLNWQDWIIEPAVYEANYCAGDCDFPLHSHMNSTNHAVVQTLVNLLNPDLAPKACCAPTKLARLHIIYFSQDAAVFRKKKNMIVKSCGCQ
ncbi:hypothetical protein HCN44_000146 [Aphidius gifuensis]|uniref:TGF-beta family profile domain-containing protein n=1 Tax=Aphidius gifuensis TaxID=684658 RepID=A0A834XP65_APHGI|nr:protein 60A-like [Aphidius gifuensis]KAF7990341.1 hypothetical protein HCN44_000146 [Aphidius gifuensis]